MTPGRRVDTPSAQAGARTRTNARVAGAVAARGTPPPAARAYELDARISEAAFTAQVEQLARLGGWLRYHTHDSRRSPAGFPDEVLLHPARDLLVFAELKTQRGRVRPEQRAWLDALAPLASPPQVHLWRPHQFQEIAELLLGPLAGGAGA